MEEYKKTIYLYNDEIGRVDYVGHMGDDLTVVNSARVSFGKQKEALDEKDKKLIRYLIKHRHTSTLEHNTVTFRFVVPLFVRSQHHRHRTWSYNEISRRYTDFDIKFYTPNKFRTQHKSNRQASNEDELIDPVMNWGSTWTASEMFKEQVIFAHNLYKDLMLNGVCREQARAILPQTMYTEYYGTCNLSNLLKFIDLRSHEGAQWEIQKVAEACLEIATDLYPETVGAYRKIKNEKLSLNS